MRALWGWCSPGSNAMRGFMLRVTTKSGAWLRGWRQRGSPLGGGEGRETRSPRRENCVSRCIQFRQHDGTGNAPPAPRRPPLQPPHPGQLRHRRHRGVDSPQTGKGRLPLYHLTRPRASRRYRKYAFPWTTLTHSDSSANRAHFRQGPLPHKRPTASGPHTSRRPLSARPFRFCRHYPRPSLGHSSALHPAFSGNHPRICPRSRSKIQGEKAWQSGKGHNGKGSL